MNPELKKNLSSGDHWVRALYVILFLVFAKVAGFLVALVAIVQVIFSLVTGQFNRQLLRFGDSLAQYLVAVFYFVVGKTEGKPFPFADWPASDIPDEEPSVSAVVEPAPEAPVAKSQVDTNSENKADEPLADESSENGGSSSSTKAADAEVVSDSTADSPENAPEDKDDKPKS